MYNKFLDDLTTAGAASSCCREIPSLGFANLRCFALLALALMSVACPASAGCACGSEEWDPYAFIDAAFGDTASSAGEASPAKVTYRAESYPRGDLLADMPAVSSSELLLDPSGNEPSEEIAGSISLPAMSLLDSDGALKDPSEISAILGRAGISSDRAVVVVGSDLSSGEPTLVVWLLRYMGQEDVSLLDGDQAAWKTAGLPMASGEPIEEAEYTPRIRAGLLIEGDLPEGVSIADVREFQVYAQDRLPGAISLDTADLVDGGRIEDEADLDAKFVRFSPDRPVVVCSDDYPSATLAWYAFELMGFDASIYIRDGADAPASPETSRFTRLGTT
ncbi:MAG: hypothetical protein JW986_03290 [Methanotrichaceae archaeon]|nr:hypothetical protein [Methanotrichaceae archaeon]